MILSPPLGDKYLAQAIQSKVLLKRRALHPVLAFKVGDLP
jgi:hypothetical protein